MLNRSCALKTGRFTQDDWVGEGSRGLTRVIQDGEVVEKGGVSTSFIHAGVLSPARAKTDHTRDFLTPIQRTRRDFIS